jgi:hypothetical protein
MQAYPDFQQSSLGGGSGILPSGGGAAQGAMAPGALQTKVETA